MEIYFSKKFLRELKKLPHYIQEETYKKVDLFKDRKNHSSLKLHKLHGKYDDCFSFSVNTKIRIITLIGNNKAHFVTIGDHDVYK